MKRVETAPAATLCGGLSRVSRGPRSRLHRRGKDGRDEQAQACFLVDTLDSRNGPRPRYATDIYRTVYVYILYRYAASRTYRYIQYILLLHS